MAQTTSSRPTAHEEPGERTTAQQPSNPAQRAMLWTELTRQRASLLTRADVSLMPDEEPEICTDLADQASIDFEQDLAMQVKTRTFDKLRRIERALQLMRTSRYGRCRHCGQDIPYERLRVQPDALFCVPCLTIVERKEAGH